MENLEEALRNIDVFCKVLVDKITADANRVVPDVFVEPIEKLLYKKNFVNERPETNLTVKHFVPLPHLEDPLIDVVEENNRFKILVQERCRDKPLTIHIVTDGIEICRKECHTDSGGEEVCVDKCQKLGLPLDRLQIENLTARCSNNTVFEVDIPKRSM
jgi:hypothetical protein